MDMKPWVLAGVCCLMLLGAGCSVAVHPESTIPTKPATDANGSSVWVAVAPFIEKLVFSDQEKSHATAVIYRAARGAFNWHFVQSTSVHPVATWADALPKAVLVSNGVYFTDEGLPAGFLSINGTRIGTHVFDANKSGAFVLTPEPHIIDTAAKQLSFKEISDGAQSYPILIRHGVDALTTSTSTAVARRTFVGTDKQQNVYVGIISDQVISLGNLAHLLMRTGIPWDMVLNLDGGPSSGIYVRAVTSTELINSDTGVANVLVAEP